MLLVGSLTANCAFPRQGGVHRSSFIVHRSSFGVRRSAFGVRRSANRARARRRSRSRSLKLEGGEAFGQQPAKNARGDDPNS